MGRQWLEHQFGGSAMAIDAALRPWPSEYMEAWDVSPLLNSPDNDTPACVQPFASSQPSKRQLAAPVANKRLAGLVQRATKWD